MKLHISFSLKTWDKNRLTHEQFNKWLKSLDSYTTFSLNESSITYEPDGRNSVAIKADITFKGNENERDLISYVSIETLNYHRYLKEYLKVRDVIVWISK